MNKVQIILPLILSLGLSLPVIAGESVMKSIFSGTQGQTTSSPAGSFKTSTQNNYSMGGGTFRVRQVNTTIVGMRAPKLTAGCGGIDFFAGTFSIMNKDELIQMGRAIMQGVPNYAFGLALTSICPDCFEQMKIIQEKLEKLNKLAGNSCALSAKIIGEEGAKSIKTTVRAGSEAVISTFKTAVGYKPDAGSFLTGKEGVDADSSADVKKLINMNLLAKAYSQAETHNMLSIYSDDPEVTKGFFLAITGTLLHVVSKDETGENSDIKVTPYNPLISIRDLISKDPKVVFKRYKCVATADSTQEECLHMVEQPEPSWLGLSQMYEEALLGPLGAPYTISGLAFKYRTSQEITLEEKTFIESFSIPLQDIFETLHGKTGMIVTVAKAAARIKALQVGSEFAAEIRKVLVSIEKTDLNDDIAFAGLKRMLEINIDTLDQEMESLSSQITAGRTEVATVITEFEKVKRDIEASKVK
jgi:conjugative transfer pilus assembly protein TraH